MDDRAMHQIVLQVVRIMRKEGILPTVKHSEQFPIWAEMFLEHLKESGGRVMVAIHRSSASKTRLYNFRKNNPEFRMKWDHVRNEAKGMER